MKKKNEVLSRYPSYKLLPWEEEEVKEYAEKANDFFSWHKDKRRAKEKLRDAEIGAGGELAFKNMLKEEKKKLILEHPAVDLNFGSPYDFKVKGGDREFHIDIKTTLKSDKVQTPDSCNFVWGFTMANIKSKNCIQLCDIYVQMFYDPDESTYYYIGAISLEKITEYRDGKRRWFIPGDNYGVIKQEDMDYSLTFLDLIDNTYRKSTDLQNE